jgi:NAD(P)-dependent dehydrogenase (short-subunit alcohol dehydrogenase family)
MPRAVLILGATSPMARAAAYAFAARGDRLFLAARDEAECQRVAQDLMIRFQIKAFWGCFEAHQTESHPDLIARAATALGGLDYALFAVGDLGLEPNSLDPLEATRLIQANFSGVASVIGACAAYMGAHGGSVILGVGSVAGDRGRQSNFVYGAAKGGLALYLLGLRNLLYSKGIRVVIFKPGFVDTGMTYGKPGLFLVASPGQAGRAIVRAMDKSSGVVYFPWFWRWIMWVIRLIPEAVFKRLKL